MKVRVLKEFLNNLTEEQLDKELAFYDEKNMRAYYFVGKEVVEVVDLDDDHYLDLVFNN